MGRLEKFSVVLPFRENKRTVRVYLPKAYDTNSEKHFPVLYMHDGQNLFEDETSFVGVSWGIKDTMEALEDEGKTEGFIVVGLDNEGAVRTEDYSPWINTVGKTQYPVGTCGGDGDKYADYFVNELKPLIDSKYRTLKGMKNIAIAGSSLGGVISAYIMAKYPDIYGYGGIFSIASWFSEENFLKYLRSASISPQHKYFIHSGTNETSDEFKKEMPQMYLNNYINYLRVLLEKGVPIGNIHLGLGYGEIHHESCWAAHMREFLGFLFN